MSLPRKGYFSPPVIIILALITFAVALTLFLNADLVNNSKNKDLQNTSPHSSPPTVINKPSPTPGELANSSSKASATEDWKTYTNEDYTYNLLIPSNWTVSTYNSKTEIEIKDVNNLRRITIYSFNDPEFGGDWCNGSIDIREESILISGYQGTKYTCYNEDKNTPGGIVLHFPNINAKRSYHLEANIVNDFDTIDRIVKSFTFK